VEIPRSCDTLAIPTAGSAIDRISNRSSSARVLSGSAGDRRDRKTAGHSTETRQWYFQLAGCDLWRETGSTTSPGCVSPTFVFSSSLFPSLHLFIVFPFVSFSLLRARGALASLPSARRLFPALLLQTAVIPKRGLAHVHLKTYRAASSSHRELQLAAEERARGEARIDSRSLGGLAVRPGVSTIDA